jgi:hypothetical protein
VQGDLTLSYKCAQERIRVARCLADLPVLRKALGQDLVSYSAAREITRVATPASEQRWLEVSTGKSMRELERLVSASKEGEVPGQQSFGLPENRMRIELNWTPEELARAEVVLAREVEESGRKMRLPDLLASLIRERYETKSSSDGASKPTTGARTRRRSTPELVCVHCTSCKQGGVVTEQGIGAVSTERMADVEKVARIRDARAQRATTRPGVPLSPRGDSLVTVSRVDTPEVPMEERDQPVDESLRQAILARDGHGCQAPDCTSRQNLHVHHGLWRRHGGQSEPDNLLSLCSCHHGLVHQSRLVSWGTATSGFHWEGSKVDRVAV